MTLIRPYLDLLTERDLYARIYSYLGTFNQRAFRSITKQFHGFFNESYPSALKVGKFIQENYEIIGGSPSRSNEYFFCSPGYSLSLGEGHATLGHQLVNGITVNLLWNQFGFPSALFVEGGPSQLAAQKKGTMQLKYVASHICHEAQTWDMDFVEEPCYKNLVHNIHCIINHTQNLLQLYAQIDDLSLDQCIAYIDRIFGKNTLTSAKIWESISTEFDPSKVMEFSSIQQFLRAHWDTEPTARYRIKFVLEYWSLIYLKQCLAQPRLVNEWRQFNKVRNMLLTFKIVMKSTEKVNVFLFSGRKHTVALRDGLQKYKYLRYLCLAPLKKSEAEIVASLLRHIFEYSVPSTLPALQQKPEKSFETLEPSIQKQRLFALNVRHISGYGKNHYGVWKRRILCILNNEIKNTKKILATFAS